MDDVQGEMNPEVKADWLRALRSGDYRQGVGALRSGDKYCCLGVLCDLAVKADVIPEPEELDKDYGYVYGYELGILPDTVKDWAGIEHKNGSYSEEGCLSQHNDSGLTFAEIADIIEREF